jgi:hypothetical protein
MGKPSAYLMVATALLSGSSRTGPYFRYDGSKSSLRYPTTLEFQMGPCTMKTTR